MLAPMLALVLALVLAPAHAQVLATDADLLKLERSGPPSCDGRGRYSPLPSSTSPSGPESGGLEGCCGRHDGLRGSSRVPWAQRLARIYEVLPLSCLVCRGEIRIISYITRHSGRKGFRIRREPKRRPCWRSSLRSSEAPAA